MNENRNGKVIKKPWEAPELKVYGTVEELTQGSTRGTRTTDSTSSPGTWPKPKGPNPTPTGKP